MAVTQSVINIYSDQQLTTLVTSVTTSGSNSDIEIAGLSAGTRYWATAQATESGVASDESAGFSFYTLPQIVFHAVPTASAAEITSYVDVTTVHTKVKSVGVIYDTHNDFSHPEYCELDLMAARYELTNIGPISFEIKQNTTYYLKPYVVDSFNRTWVNDSAAVSILSGTSAPTISWYGKSAVGITDFHSSISVDSDVALTSVVAVYTPDGGSPVTVNLTNSTGVQAVNLTGLQPNTIYSVVCTATNAAGSSSTSALSFTTNQAELTVELKDVTVSSEFNIVSAVSNATYDSNTITITDHWVDLYENDEHRGTAFDSVSGGANAVVDLNLSHANPDETYFVFGRVTYTIGNDPTVKTAWSAPWEILTYSLFSFGKKEVDNTDAKVDFSVGGDTKSTVVEYSTDGENWEKVPVKDPTGEKLYFTGLEPNTTYYLRGRTLSPAGWSDYATASFSTGSQAATDIYTTSITNVSITSATIKLTIE